MAAFERLQQAALQDHFCFARLYDATQQCLCFLRVQCGQQRRHHLATFKLLFGDMNAQVFVVKRRCIRIAFKQVALLVQHFKKAPAGPAGHMGQCKHLGACRTQIQLRLMLKLPGQVTHFLLLHEAHYSIIETFRQWQVFLGQVTQPRQGQIGDGCKFPQPLPRQPPEE